MSLNRLGKIRFACVRDLVKDADELSIYEEQKNYMSLLRRSNDLRKLANGKRKDSNYIGKLYEYVSFFSGNLLLLAEN